MSDVVVALVAFVTFGLMEPLTTFTHRLVMHGFGMGWHRSHHRPPLGRFEANDLFPLTFAAVTIVALAVGVYGPAPAWLVPVGVGVTAYGAAYLFVHDVVIHRRLGGLPIPDAFLRRLQVAHAMHHRFGHAPYGFLCPVTPRRFRNASRPTTASLRADVTRQRRVKTS